MFGKKRPEQPLWSFFVPQLFHLLALINKKLEDGHAIGLSLS
jgi:hypothetical protein